MNPDLVKWLQTITGGIILLLVLWMIVVKQWLIPGWIFEKMVKQYEAIISELKAERDEANRRYLAKVDPDYNSKALVKVVS